ncbi:MAG: TDT family transporter [Firmicutes bacterium]|nr:TDT family transporter [Bacillota bacterium]
MVQMLRHFGPNWFTVGMGTGITALGAYLYPGAPGWLREAGTVLWLFNTLLVGLFLILIHLRMLLDRPGMKAILHDPVQSMFWGAMPMALTTVVNGFVDMGPGVFGPVAVQVAFVVWVANVAMAVVAGIVVPYMMFIRQDHALDRLTGIWLIPVVPAEVVAASGSLLIPYVVGLEAQRTLLLISMGLWALSVPLAFLILGFLFLRLALHKLPPKEMAASTWISLGTLGTGVMGLVGLGRYMPLVFGTLGQAMAGGSVLAALMLWGFGLWWLAISILLTLHYLKRGMPFNLGWWGLTFPLGVFTGGTDFLYRQLGDWLLQDMARGLFVMLAVFWLVVAVRTVVGLVRRCAWVTGGVPHAQRLAAGRAS